MFEAARQSKTGVTHIKDLDMALAGKAPAPEVPLRDTLKRVPATCSVSLINPMTGEIKTDQKKERPQTFRFEFNSQESFNTANDSVKVAKEAWDWLLNPLGVEHFKLQIKEK